jgi:protein MpaA
MSTAVSSPFSISNRRALRRRSIADLLAPLEELAANSASLVAKPVGQFEHGTQRYEIPRYLLVGNSSSDTPIRVGIFAGIHGDEPEGVHALVQFAGLLESTPELAAGYCLFLYPVCNPTGLEDGTRHSRNGKDLNREFWRNSNEPEVRLLQAELVSQSLDGMIALHTDEHSNGLYGFVRGATLTRHLLRPALAAAAELLPVNQDDRIDGFHAKDGLIEDCYEGVLSAPPKVRPKPFEITLESPGQAPLYLRQSALLVALPAILGEYRKFIAYAPNL